MIKNPFYLFSIGFLLLISSLSYSQAYDYQWLDKYNQSDAVVNLISTPKGYKRLETVNNTFEDWLRHIPVKKGNPPVMLFNGKEKLNQNAHFAVLDVDIGNKDLQQCADAIIRLRGEYLYSNGDYDKIHFNFTSGHKAEFSQWIKGYRPIVLGNRVKWVKTAKTDFSYNNLRAYLDTVFRYAGSFSLSREMKPIHDLALISIGDVFIQGGFPGHAVIVMDMAVSEKTGKKIFILAQSYMPAQEIHILKNLNNIKLNPWYELDFDQVLNTPEWIFNKGDLMRFQ